LQLESLTFFCSRQFFAQNVVSTLILTWLAFSGQNKFSDPREKNSNLILQMATRALEPEFKTHRVQP
jgi:hypothetical protein